MHLVPSNEASHKVLAATVESRNGTLLLCGAPLPLAPVPVAVLFRPGGEERNRQP